MHANAAMALSADHRGHCILFFTLATLSAAATTGLNMEFWHPEDTLKPVCGQSVWRALLVLPTPVALPFTHAFVLYFQMRD